MGIYNFYFFFSNLIISPQELLDLGILRILFSVLFDLQSTFFLTHSIVSLLPVAGLMFFLFCPLSLCLIGQQYSPEMPHASEKVQHTPRLQTYGYLIHPSPVLKI